MRLTDKNHIKKLVAKGRLPHDAIKIQEVSDRVKKEESRLRGLLLERYGDYFSGGETVFELQNVIPGRQFRFDAALVQRLVLIELDGFADHGKSLKGFKRDRVKSLLATQQGWHVLHVTTEILKKQPAILFDAIEAIKVNSLVIPQVIKNKTWTRLIN